MLLKREARGNRQVAVKIGGGEKNQNTTPRLLASSHEGQIAHEQYHLPSSFEQETRQNELQMFLPI